jgi:hypothetical protein
MSKTTKNNTTKLSKKRVTTQSNVVSRFEKVEDNDVITMRIAKRERVNSRLTMLPRSTKDRRVREWTEEETLQAKEWYKKGMSRNTIAKLLDVSHAPLNKMLHKEGVLSVSHIVAAYKCGYLK